MVKIFIKCSSLDGFTGNVLQAGCLGLELGEGCAVMKGGTLCVAVWHGGREEL